MDVPSSTIAIVGGGQAAVELAFGLRKEGHEGRVVIICEEAHPPYQRPPLSKTYLLGKSGADDLYLRPLDTYREAGIELVLGTRVRSIDRPSRQLELDDETSLTYDKLALTVGGRARPLPILQTCHDYANVHSVRSIADVDALKKHALSGQSVVIIGGGYIGLEAASATVTLGAEVTVVEALPRVLARVTSPQMSKFYESVHRAHGVRMITGASVIGVVTDESGSQVTGLTLDNGEELSADVVLVGIGLMPNTELAEAAGLVVDGGIVVDESCRTSDPHIYAAGDCTLHPSAQLDGEMVRVESVSNAVDQGRVAARAMVGKEAVHDSIPWFWSDQYHLKLQMVGRSAEHDETVVRGTAEEMSFTTFYLREGVLIGADVVNRPADFVWARRLVAQHLRPPAESLADADVPLKSLLSQSGG